MSKLGCALSKANKANKLKECLRRGRGEILCSTIHSREAADNETLKMLEHTMFSAEGKRVSSGFFGGVFVFVLYFFFSQLLSASRHPYQRACSSLSVPCSPETIYIGLWGDYISKPALMKELALKVSALHDSNADRVQCDHEPPVMDDPTIGDLAND